MPARADAGFRFTVDTVGETGPNAGVLAAVRGAVTFVAGRGRLDVIAVRRAPTLSVRGVRIAAPLAAPGDYYLFDSAGAVLVHPTTRTFSRLALADGSYNYEERRDGWPAAFQMEPTRPDTLRGASAVSARVATHGPVPIYWHLDLKAVPPSPPIRIIARGRVQLVDAPAGEASVARWFGAAEALATLPSGVAATRGAPLRVTAVVALQPPGDSTSVVNLVTQVPLTDLAPAAVDRSRLVPPTELHRGSVRRTCLGAATRSPGRERRRALARAGPRDRRVRPRAGASGRDGARDAGRHVRGPG